jgi:acyl carrier protein
VKLLQRIFGKSKSERLLIEQSDLWALRHYPEAQRAVAARVVRVVVEQQGVLLEELSPATRFLQDLKMYDHLEGVELAMGIEEEFGLKLPDDDAEAMDTIDDIVTYLCERFPGNAA